ncbi:MAG: protease inhibitor I42 family protein [Candidatus Paceibacterota bacterium]|jgi:predicted secreted protein
MKKNIQKTKKGYDLPKAIIAMTTIVLYGMLIGAIGYILIHSEPIVFDPVIEPDPAPVENLCAEKAKVEMTCSKVGYEFDLDQNKCVVVNGAGCIDRLPFGSLKECQEACEEPVEAVQATVGEDILITLDSNVTTGYSWEAEFDEHYFILRSKDFISDRNSPKLGAAGKEVFTFTPIQAGEAAITMGYGRPRESGPIDTKIFNYIISGNADVSLETGKTEYEKGEAISIIMENISSDPIWFMEGVSNCNTRPYRIFMLYSGEWREVSGYPAICVGSIEEQAAFYTALRSEFPVNLQWDQKLWDYPRQTYDADAGTYRIVMKYGKSPDGNGGKDLYSNEFTIKETSAADPRCGKAVSGSGKCKAYWLGVEFDESAGECVKRGVSGCSFETPFENIEECRAACETQADPYSCETDMECVAVNKDYCGCTAGGSLEAINKKYLIDRQEKMQQGEMMCPAVMSDDPSCFQQPKCVKNKCVMQ